MTLLGAKSGPSPVDLQDPVVRLLRDLVHERTGTFFGSDRLGAMLEKLHVRAIARGCRSYLEYYYIIKYDEKGAGEWRRVMDAFSVQETYFWRELDQIRALVDRIVPEWFKNTPRPLRIWSAACASGEEPYSMAIALREAGWEGHPIEILASDASEAALAKARGRFYRERSFRALPQWLRDKYFEPRDDGFCLRPEVGADIKFRWGNLLDLEELPEAARVDVIFCRNVFIYFSPTAVANVVSSFARRVPPRGHLFVGASESLLKLTADFELREFAGAFVYVRK